MSRVLATSSERFHYMRIQIQKLSTVYPGLSCRQNVIRQLATSSENLVASTQFLVALATSESQFQALRLRERNVQNCVQNNHFGSFKAGDY